MNAVIHALMQTNPMTGIVVTTVLLLGIVIGFVGGVVIF